MIFDKTGALATTSRHDYLPFGEEVFANTGSRTTTQGYTAVGNPSADKARQKFTGYEQDSETGLISPRLATIRAPWDASPALTQLVGRRAIHNRSIATPTSATIP